MRDRPPARCRRLRGRSRPGPPGSWIRCRRPRRGRRTPAWPPPEWAAAWGQYLRRARSRLRGTAPLDVVGPFRTSPGPPGLRPPARPGPPLARTQLAPLSPCALSLVQRAVTWVGPSAVAVRRTPPPIHGGGAPSFAGSARHHPHYRGCDGRGRSYGSRGSAAQHPRRADVTRARTLRSTPRSVKSWGCQEDDGVEGGFGSPPHARWTPPVRRSPRRCGPQAGPGDAPPGCPGHRRHTPHRCPSPAGPRRPLSRPGAAPPAP